MRLRHAPHGHRLRRQPARTLTSSPKLPENTHLRETDAPAKDVAAIHKTSLAEEARPADCVRRSGLKQSPPRMEAQCLRTLGRRGVQPRTLSSERGAGLSDAGATHRPPLACRKMLDSLRSQQMHSPFLRIGDSRMRVSNNRINGIRSICPQQDCDKPQATRQFTRAPRRRSCRPSAQLA